jgi:small subunit ribosomal protein S11
MAKVSGSSKKKVRRDVEDGSVIVQASFNNTMVTITDTNGDVLAWATAGASFSGSRKCTPFAAQTAARKVAEVAKGMGMKTVSVMVKGPGPGREAAIRAMSDFFNVKSIRDITPVPHNGCRAKKRRRV